MVLWFKCKNCGKKIGVKKKVYDVCIKEGFGITKECKQFKKVIKKYNILEDEIEIDRENGEIRKRDITLHGSPEIEVLEGTIVRIEEVKPTIEKENNKTVYKCPHCNSVLMTVVKGS